MALISDKSHRKKLKDFNINIKTNYIVGNSILERNTDDSYNDDINNGIRCKKYYYVNDKLMHVEKLFDSRIEYTFISKNQDKMNYKCPNCGMEAKIKDFTDGCPYCRTHYNIDYTDKDLGSKYHYDLVLRNTTYRIITAIVDVIVSIILSFIFIKATSRTFNSYDVSKIFIYGIILSLILYYFFYIIDGYIILGPIKRYKDRQNKKQFDFWNRTKIDKKVFFNNLNYEVRNKYYSAKNIVDYDIIDFIEFSDFYKKDILYVTVIADVRIVSFNGSKFKVKYIKDKYVMKKIHNNIYDLKEGTNLIKCHNCGNAIDVTKGYCEHCRTDTRYYQEWVLDK